MTQEQWVGDIFQRRGYADKWGKYLITKIATHQGGLTVALDAPWGAGKSFFVKRWAESLKKNHPVVIFDAWKNDHVGDPMIAFMAELTKAIREIQDTEDLKPDITEQVSKTSAAMVKSMSKAWLPAAKVVGKGVLKKISGVDAGEVIDALIDGDAATIELSISAADAQNALGDGIEQFMKKTLEAYDQRNKGISAFQESLQELLRLVDANSSIHKPLFVFIDEVDRCRPDFAVRLLEEVKHIFSVSGIVFVLCVNIDQLSKSVCALYGSEFDGQRYLHRFFDLEFRLPRPTNLNYAKLLLKDSHLLSAGKFEKIYVKGGQEDFTARSFSDVTELFGLSLREQEHIFNSASLAAADLGKVTLHLHWLFYLAALKYRLPAWFSRLEEGSADADDIGKMTPFLAQPGAMVSIYSKTPEHTNWVEQEMSLSELFQAYYTVWKMTGTQAIDFVNGDAQDFRHDIVLSFIQGPRSLSKNNRLGGAQVYIDTVATCGLRS